MQILLCFPVKAGLGHLTTGDKPVGLSQLLICTGTRSHLASLWQVADESTGYVMKRFCKNLKMQNKAEALRQAQNSTLKKYKDVFHRGSVVFIGEE